MFNFKDSIHVPSSLYMGGQQDSLTYRDGDFKFYIAGKNVLDINASGISGGGILNSNVLFIDEVDKRVGINVSNPDLALDVSGDAIIRGNFAINGELADIVADAAIEGSLTVAGNVVALDGTVDNLFVAQNADIQETLTLGDFIANQDGIVAGDLTVSGDLNANIDVSFDGVVDTLNVTNDAMIGGDLIVGSTGFFGGDVTIAGRLYANEDIANRGVFENVSVTEFLNVTGSALVIGDLSVSGALNANINVSFNGVVDSLTVSTNAVIGQNLYTPNAFCENIDITGDMNVSQDALIIGTLSVSGPIINNTNQNVLDLTVSNNLTVGNQLLVRNDGLIEGDLSVSGNLIANIDVSFDGIVESLYVSTDAFVVDNLSIGSHTSIDATGVTFQNVDLTIRGASDFNTILSGNMQLIVDGQMGFQAGLDNLPIVFLGNMNAGTPLLFVRKDASGAANQEYIRFFHTGAVNAGSIRADGTGTLLIDNTSSILLKENIRDNEEECYDIMKRLRGVKFNWKSSPELGDCNGFIAEEVEEVYPVASGDMDGIKSVTQGSFTPVMWSAMRKLIKDFESLKEDHDILKAKYDELSGN